jgi:hypothetical protein
MRSPAGPKPVREPEEVFLIDGVEHRDERALNDLVFQRSDAQRALFVVDARPPEAVPPWRPSLSPSAALGSAQPRSRPQCLGRTRRASSATCQQSSTQWRCLAWLGNTVPMPPER